MRNTDGGDPDVPRIRETVITAADALVRTLYRLPECGIVDGSPNFKAFDGSQLATRRSLRELHDRLHSYFGTGDLA